MPIGSQGLQSKIKKILEKFKNSVEMAQMASKESYRSLTYEEIYGTQMQSKIQVDPLDHNPFEHATINHHAYFYQNSAFVAHFLVRTHPEYAMEIDKRIDVDRGFRSIPGAYSCI